MCYDSNARPPEPPKTNGHAHGENIVLTARDGTRFAAYIANPTNPTGAQVIIYPDVRGLHQFYKELALRFAETGTRALAIDYFGRTAGLSARDDSFEYMSHVQQTRLDTLLADATAASDYLHAGGNTGHLFIVGFCFGGSLSLMTGREDLGQEGVIAFYASLSRVFPGASGSVLELAKEIRCPVLGLFGGADAHIPVSDVQKLDEELKQAGIEHEVLSYDGAPHSFFDRRSTEFAEASSDAWTRVLNFIAAHSK
jgi:carboxymethylenebutenolidase